MLFSCFSHVIPKAVRIPGIVIVVFTAFRQIIGSESDEKASNQGGGVGGQVEEGSVSSSADGIAVGADCASDGDEGVVSE